jgi:tRNA A-37 threonylcarbamoyl transferase component Bud32
MCSRSSRSNIDSKLEEYRISSVHTNAAYKIPFSGSFVFLKIYGHKYPRMPYAIRRFLSGLGIRQPVEYTSPYRRRDFEKEILRYWMSSGYHVPEIIDNPFHELSHVPVLTTRYIEGMTMREFVQSDKVGAVEKKEKTASLFRDISVRHHSALGSGDNRLFHIDANTRNILLADNTIFHCDFEMGRPWESPVECASREVLKVLVSLIEDMDPSCMENLLTSFKDIYKEKAVYACIAKGISGRPFQVAHRYLNRRKKEKNPGKVTLYDILSCLS